MSTQNHSCYQGFSNVSLKDLMYFDKKTQTSKFKFLDMEKTNIVTFVLIHVFIFVIPLFASILLLADSIQPLHVLLSEDQMFEIKIVFGKSLILLCICGISFLEIFALLSKVFVTFVCTEILLWIVFLFGLSYAYELPVSVSHHNGPIVAISVCILFKVCVGIFLRRQLRVWLKSKTFLRRLGKSV